MNNTDVIYEIIIFLERRKFEINEEIIKSGREVGSFLNYEKIDDFTININYGFSDFEEGSDNTSIIKISNDIITVDTNSDEHSVMEGDYVNNDHINFDNLTELIQWLTEEI